MDDWAFLPTDDEGNPYYGGSITSVTFAEDCEVEEIGDQAFAGTEIEKITLPASVTTIGDKVFEGCTYLRYAKFQGTIASLGNLIFEGCTAMERIVIENIDGIVGDGSVGATNRAFGISDNQTFEIIITGTLQGQGLDRLECFRYDNQGVLCSDLTIYVLSPEVKRSYDEFVQLVQYYNHDSSVMTKPDEVIAAKAFLYEREFANDLWQPLVLPFDAPFSQLIDRFEIAQLTRVKREGDTDVLEYTMVYNSSIIIHGVPYIIRKKSNVKLLNNYHLFSYVSNIDYNLSSLTTVGGVGVAGYNNYSLYATYKAGSVEEGNEYTPEGYEPDLTYALTNKGAFKKVSSPADIKANRIFLVAPAPEPNQTPRKITVQIDGEEQGDATGIGVIFDHEPATADSHAIYDLSGRRVQRPAKGLYIQNGKKFTIK